MHPASSRAMATVTTLACWPCATRRRSRLHSLPLAFQLMSWMILGCFASRRCRCRLIGWVAGGPGACNQHPSGMGVTGFGNGSLPASLGTGVRCGNQAEALRSSLGFSQRVRSPMSATRVMATVHWTPRRACGAATTGCKRHDLTCSCSACKALEACGMLLDRTDICWKDDVLRWCGAHHCREPPQVGRVPIRPAPERISCLHKKAVRRNLASLQSRMASSRAR